jgi:hypothetical protein
MKVTLDQFRFEWFSGTYQNIITKDNIGDMIEARAKAVR